MSMSWRHVQDRSTIKDNHVARFFRVGANAPLVKHRVQFARPHSPNQL